MRITLLGTGGPRPDPMRQGPATLVQAEALNLVFDAGRGVASQLAKTGVSTRDVDAITHIREKPAPELDRMRAQVQEIFGGEVILGHDLMAIDL